MYLQIGIHVLVIILGLINRHKEIVTLYTAHLEIKLGGITGIKLAKYDDIVCLENISQKKLEFM